MNRVQNRQAKQQPASVLQHCENVAHMFILPHAFHISWILLVDCYCGFASIHQNVTDYKVKKVLLRSCSFILDDSTMKNKIVTRKQWHNIVNVQSCTNWHGSDNLFSDEFNKKILLVHTEISDIYFFPKAYFGTLANKSTVCDNFEMFT